MALTDELAEHGNPSVRRIVSGILGPDVSPLHCVEPIKDCPLGAWIEVCAPVAQDWLAVGARANTQALGSLALIANVLIWPDEV